jgi:hypothetical protein
MAGIIGIGRIHDAAIDQDMAATYERPFCKFSIALPGDHIVPCCDTCGIIVFPFVFMVCGDAHRCLFIATGKYTYNRRIRDISDELNVVVFHCFDFFVTQIVSGKDGVMKSRKNVSKQIYLDISVYTRFFEGINSSTFKVMEKNDVTSKAGELHGTNVPSFCLYCDKGLPAGSRPDKKFCDEKCKNAYYNELKIKEHKEIRNIDLMLKRNRRILKKIVAGKDDAAVKKEQLLELGFQLNYHTHHVISKTAGNEYIFCYDYGYFEYKPGIFRIVKGFPKKEF